MWPDNLSFSWHGFQFATGAWRVLVHLWRALVHPLSHQLVNLFLGIERNVAFWYPNLRLVPESSRYLVWLTFLCSWTKARQRWTKRRPTTVLQWFPKSGNGVRKKTKFLNPMDSPQSLLLYRSLNESLHTICALSSSATRNLWKQSGVPKWPLALKVFYRTYIFCLAWQQWLSQALKQQLFS